MHRPVAVAAVLRVVRVLLHPIVWLVALLAVFFSAEVFGGRVFSPADLLFEYAPWKTVAPAGFTGASNPVRSDEAFIYLPRRLQMARDLLAHGLTFWQSHTLVGGPVTLTADQLGMFLYPPMWAFLLAKPGVANTVLHLSVPLLAGLCMYPLTGRISSRPLARFAGVAAWSLNGYLIVWLSAVQLSVIVAVFPLLVLLGIKVLERPTGAAVFGYATLLAWTFFSGYPPGNIVLCVLLGVGLAGFLLATDRRSWRGLAWLAIATVLGLGTASFAISAMVHEVLAVAGSQYRGPILPLPLKDLQSFFLPNVFGNPAHGDWAAADAAGDYSEWIAYAGIVTLVPAVTGALGAVVRRGPQRAVVVGALVIGLVSVLLAYAAGPAGLVDQLPILRELRPARWQIGIAFAIIVAGVYGLDLIFEKGIGAWAPLIAGATVGLLAAAIAYHQREELAGSDQFISHDDLLRLGLLAATLVLLAGFLLWGRIRGLPTRPARTFFEGAIVLLLLVDMVSFGKGFNPSIPPSEFYPATPAIRYLEAHAQGTRVLAFDSEGGLFPGDTLNVYGIDSLTGYDHLREESLVQLLGTNISPGERALWAQSGYLFLGGPSLDLDSRVFDLLAVGYAYQVNATRPAQTWRHWAVVYQGADGTIYRNLEALPGRFLVSGSKTVPIAGGGLSPITNSLSVRGAGTLVWSQPLDPGFSIRVDGRPASLETYDDYFLAVRLGPGDHTVELSYLPPGYSVGVAGSAISFLALLALSLWLVRSRRRRRPGSSRH